MIVPHCIHCAFTLCIQMLLLKMPQHLPSVYKSLLIFFLTSYSLLLHI